ncbi:uncharacterized protein isoform X1 [Rhodnius prolixus]|uniref:uncharacterized protein isoform X1 n=1 Tax=Rhodnius prolixus TaxID=13249 RepID=UPI003D18B066
MERSIGRRFGGYRIVPKSCKDVSTFGKSSGICMFNYECSKKNGTVIGSCMDGFLFGACCRLPPGANFVAIDIPDRPSTYKTTTSLKPEHLNVDSTTATIHGVADTVLLHENGTIANEASRPEDFEFNSKPELYVATDVTTSLPTRYATNSQKSTTWKVTTENWLTTKHHRPWTTLADDNLVEVPTLSAGSEQDADSINHILSILDDNNTPIAEPKPQFPGESSTTPTLSTWVSVDSKLTTSPYNPTTPAYTQSHKTTLYTKPSTNVHVTLFHTTESQKQTYSTPKPYTTPVRISTHKPQIHHSTSRPSTTIASYHPTTSQQQTSHYKPLKPQSATQKPLHSYTKKPTTVVQIQYTTHKKPVYPATKKPSTTTQYVQGPGFQVSISPKPSSTSPEPPPTVIVLGPVNNTKKPVSPPIGTIITVNPEGNVVTYKPAPPHSSYATVKPVYHIPVYTTLKPEISTHGVSGSHPYRPIYTTPTEVIKDGITNSTELFAFPPVRDPNVNLSITQPEPEVINWMTQSTLNEEETTPPLVEDQNLDNKVHKFVEKIVQSLQGNFEDLEQVLIEGESTQNVTVNSVATQQPPVKRPTTTKKPTRRPTKKPASSLYTTTAKPSSRPKPTLPLITRPPPRPSTSSTQRPVPTKRPSPQVPSTTFFLEHTEHSTSSEPPPYSTTTQDVDYKNECGVRPLMKNGRIVGGKGATFGEWPWQVLVREATWLGLFTKNKCGGVLITNRYVITAAHCQPGRFLASLIAVFGDFDISGEVESKRSVSRNVRRVIVHRHYDAATFENDIALLELDTPVEYDQHIVPICMPEDDEDFTGKVATVSGWGRLKYGGGVPSILQEVQVPIMENNVCQEMFHTAGHSKTILQSFICAGYANGQRDSCEGDSGGPLMIERPDGRWVLAGTVSHGIKCAAPYLPGVYMRTTYYKPWLQTITGVRNL